MIEVTRLSGSTLVINGDLVERIEATPDTVITLTSGSCYLVKETVSEVVSRIIDYKAKVLAPGVACLAPLKLRVIPGQDDL